MQLFLCLMKNSVMKTEFQNSQNILMFSSSVTHVPWETNLSQNQTDIHLFFFKIIKVSMWVLDIDRPGPGFFQSDLPMQALTDYLSIV